MSRPRRALHTFTETREAFIRALVEAPHLFSDVETRAVQAVYVERRAVTAAGLHLGLSKNTVYDQIRRSLRALDWWVKRQGALQGAA